MRVSGGVQASEAGGGRHRLALGCPPHTLEIDGRRDVAPSPTPGFSLGWMLLSTVSLKDKMKERMEADVCSTSAGGLEGGEVPADLAPPSLMVCGGWSVCGAPSELTHLG